MVAVALMTAMSKTITEADATKTHIKWKWEIWAFLDFGPLSPSLWSERKGICAGMRLFLDIKYESFNSSWSSGMKALKSQNSELEAAMKCYEAKVQLLLLDKLAKKQERRTHKRKTKMWRWNQTNQRSTCGRAGMKSWSWRTTLLISILINWPRNTTQERLGCWPINIPILEAESVFKMESSNWPHRKRPACLESASVVD